MVGPLDQRQHLPGLPRKPSLGEGGELGQALSVGNQGSKDREGSAADATTNTKSVTRKGLSGIGSSVLISDF